MIKKPSKKEKLLDVQRNSAQIIIGKNGLTEELLDTIKKKLNKDKILKIKLLKTVPDLDSIGRKNFAEIVAEQVRANLIEIRGYNLILQKSRINEN